MARGRFNFRSANASVALRVFNPSWFGRRVIGWYDSSDLRSLLFQGNKVEVIRDKGPIGNHLSQSSTAFQPRHDTLPRMNGLPLITMSGSFLQNKFNLIPQPFTVAWAGTYTLLSNGTVMFGSADKDNGGVDASSVFVNQNWAFPNGFFGATAGTQLSTTSQAVPVFGSNYTRMVIQFNGASSSFRLNGVNASGNAGTRPMFGIEIGSFNNGTTPANYGFGELFVLSGTLSQTGLSYIETYLVRKWAADGRNVAEGGLEE